MKSAPPAIRIEENALHSIRSFVASAGDEETGGFLLGRFEPNGTVILHATGPGENAEKSRVHFEPDYAHTAREYERLRAGDGSLKVVGGWHLHDLDGLSAGDIRTLRRVCKDNPNFLALVVKRHD